MIRIALFEPDIPQNTATILRTAACLGVPVDLIEPCGFLFDDRRFKRTGMDYLDRVDLTRHSSWAAFQEALATAGQGRLVLLTTRADVPYWSFAFADDDVLLLGRESTGVPRGVHAAADTRLRVPILPDSRSLNVAVAAAIVLGEALRQTDGFPGSAP